MNAHHLAHIPAHVTGDEGWDRFGFAIKLEDLKRNLVDRQLVMCVRYSANGEEWWDSNQGINYNFTFERTRRQRQTSGPSSLGGGFMRLNDDSGSSISGLRQHLAQRNFTSQDDINTTIPRRSRAAVRSSSGSDYSFPPMSRSLRPRVQDGSPVPSRTDSPVPSGPPPAAFRVPNPPDVHEHLKLRKYCPPSSSPSADRSAQLPVSPSGRAQPASFKPIPLNEAPSTVAFPRPGMDVIGGQPATLSPSALSPPEASPAGRPSSWSGEKTSWETFSAHSDEQDGQSTPRVLPSDGDVTPVVARARSPVSPLASPNELTSGSKPLAMRPSTGDLQAMLEASEISPSSETTSPPTSNLSSPSPQVSMPPHLLMSSGSSSTSTGESSPLDTASTNNSLTDLANLMLDINGRQKADNKTLNQSSYQEFVSVSPWAQ